MKQLILTLTVLIATTSSLIAQNGYSNSTHKLNIVFPDGWKKQAWSNNEIQKARLYNSNAEIITLITIAVYPTGNSEMTAVNADGPSKAWDNNKEKFGQDAQDLVETGSETIGGIAMKWATTKFDLFGKKSFTKTYYFGRNDKIYRLTLQTNGGQSLYDEVLPVFEECMKTLKVS